MSPFLAPDLFEQAPRFYGQSGSFQGQFTLLMTVVEIVTLTSRSWDPGPP
jgi:hypothetical protein